MQGVLLSGAIFVTFFSSFPHLYDTFAELMVANFLEYLPRSI